MRCARRTKNSWLSMGLRAAGLLVLAVRVVQEHQIQIRGVAELHAAELAVADGADAHRRAAAPPRRTSARRTARVICRQASSMRTLDDELGDVGEAVAHLHERQRAGEVGDRHTEQRRALELPQRLDLLLRIVLAQLLQARLEIARELGAIGQLRQQPLVDQLIEQQRMGGDLLRRGSPRAGTARTSRARAARVLLQQRKIGRALADRLDDARARAAAPAAARCCRRDLGQQHRQQRLQAPPPGLIEPPHQRRAAQLQQQARHLGAVG